MLQESIAPATEAPFVILGGINTVAATPAETSHEQVRFNIARRLPKLHGLPGWAQMKGTAPIALLGAGPSLKDTLHELKDFPVTLAAVSCHDWLIENGHIPTFCSVADPDPVCANYVKHANDQTVYLLATQCHPKVFDVLEGRNIRTWHLVSGMTHEDQVNSFNKVVGDIDPEWQGVGGGCTVGLRNISIALMMGYKELHFFGYDSCYGEDNRHHVQDFSEKWEDDLLGETYRVSVNFGTDGPGEKVYRCAGYMMAQAQHFKEMITAYGAFFNPTFHGYGLLPEYARLYKARLDQAWTELRRLYTEDKPKLLSLIGEQYKDNASMILAEIEKQLEVNNVVCR